MCLSFSLTLTRSLSRHFIRSVSMVAQFLLFCFSHISMLTCSHIHISFTHSEIFSSFDLCSIDFSNIIIQKHVFIQMIVCPHVMCELRYCGGSFCFSAIFLAFNAIDFKLKMSIYSLSSDNKRRFVDECNTGTGTSSSSSTSISTKPQPQNNII